MRENLKDYEFWHLLQECWKTSVSKLFITPPKRNRNRICIIVQNWCGSPRLVMSFNNRRTISRVGPSRAWHICCQLLAQLIWDCYRLSPVEVCCSEAFVHCGTWRQICSHAVVGLCVCVCFLWFDITNNVTNRWGISRIVVCAFVVCVPWSNDFTSC